MYSESENHKGTRLVCAIFLNSWSPPSAFVGREIEKIRRALAGGASAGAAAPAAFRNLPLFVLDADVEMAKAVDLK